MTSKLSSLIREDNGASIPFQLDGYSCACFALLFLYFFCFSASLLSVKLSLFIKQVQEAKKLFDEGWERLACVNQMDEQLSETKLDMVFSSCGNEGYALYHIAHYPPHDEYCSIAIIGSFRTN